MQPFLRAQHHLIYHLRVRAAGISQAPTLAQKLAGWCNTTDTEPEPLLDRLRLLESMEVPAIVGGVL